MKHLYLLFVIVSTLLSVMLPMASAYTGELHTEGLRTLFQKNKMSASGCCTFLLEGQRCIALCDYGVVTYFFILAEEGGKKNEQGMQDAQSLAERLKKYLKKKYTGYLRFDVKPFGDGQSGYTIRLVRKYSSSSSYELIKTTPAGALKRLASSEGAQIHSIEGISIVISNPLMDIARVAFELSADTVSCINIVPNRNVKFGDENFTETLYKLTRDYVNSRSHYLHGKHYTPKDVQKMVGAKCLGVGYGNDGLTAIVYYRNSYYYGTVSKLRNFIQNKKRFGAGKFEFPQESNKLPETE